MWKVWGDLVMLSHKLVGLNIVCGRFVVFHLGMYEVRLEGILVSW